MAQAPRTLRLAFLRRPFPDAPIPSAVFPPAVKQSSDAGCTAELRMRLLDEIFLEFDELVKRAVGALKIETIAGVYLVASNGALAVFPYKLDSYSLGARHSPYKVGGV